MSRRDTIIIAVLINAALLALLFMLAINTDDDKIADQSEISHVIVENHSIPQQAATPVAMVHNESNAPDEMDNFLKDLASEEMPHPVLIDDEGVVELEKDSPVIVKSTANADANETSDKQFVEITVKRGDALEKIARSNGTSIEAIKKANNLTTSKLSIGQVLRVPLSKKNASESTAATTKPTKPIASAATTNKESEKKSTSAAAIQYYTIKSGDNPWKVAKQFNVKFEDLLTLNGLDEEKARNLKVGDKIRVK